MKLISQKYMINLFGNFKRNNKMKNIKQLNILKTLKEKIKNKEIVFFKDLVENNGDKIVQCNEAQINKKYASIFNYSNKYGGTIDSLKYYNDYVVELKGE